MIAAKRALALSCLVVAVLWQPRPSAAKTFIVGPDQELTTPSAAAKLAADGDTVEIEPMVGGYFDCAVWKQNNLTIEGKSDGVVVTDKTCQGKALFIIDGNDVTIRNLTFQRARVPDLNGAGIRAEGGNLRIEHCRFVNNESGILGVSRPRATLTIADTEFSGNGKCTSTCSHAIQIGEIALLHVERSSIRDNDAGDDIISDAHKTELVGNQIADGQVPGSSYLVDLPDGGSLVMRNNTLAMGRQSGSGVAVRIMAGMGSHPVQDLVLTGNRLTGDGRDDVTFLQNWTGTGATLSDNELGSRTTPVSSAGYLWFRTKDFGRDVIANLRHIAEFARQLLHATE